jgi:predicted MPP superfamily phosphohydrolase
MKLIWLTDIHLNFLEENKRVDFYHELIVTDSDGVVISGDIAEAPSIESILKEMASITQKPIYFVLGNHDYYYGSINDLRNKMTAITKHEPFLFWLPASGPQKLNNDVVLLGQDCFADGRYGDYASSRVVLNDSRLIVDLFQSGTLGKYSLLEKMQQLADQDANDLEKNIEQAISSYHPKKIIILIHVPPFREVCMHEGKISSDDYLPFFSSKVTGEILKHAAEAYPEVEFLVLCGHTHSKGFFKPCPNLTVTAGASEYGKPSIQEVNFNMRV